MLLAGCDTHVHVIGDAMRYAMTQGRQYTPGTAVVADLQAHLKVQGLTRAVLIQPSVYGTDNQCMLDGLQVMQGNARGVAVLDTNTTTATLKNLDTQGVRGIRLNLESSNNHSATLLQDQLKAWAPRLADVGWHVQVYAPMAVTVACTKLIEKMPVPVVLDHFALWDDANCGSKESQTLLSLLEAGHIFIKLSASYRSPIKDAKSLNKLSNRLLTTRADRLLWASDWPHTNREPGRGPFEVSRYRNISATQLLEERSHWLPTQDALQQVLVDNPAQLYRF